MFLRKFLFFFLSPFELLYRAGFFFVISYKKYRGGARGFPFKIISIGNLSVGGTGKTPLCLFLLQQLKPLRGAVVLRGYKRGCMALGDEGELYREAGALVRASPARAQSCRELANLVEQGKAKIDFVLLDDAYQNFQLYKDFEILVLDARRPFENGHCLPAGRLRENDFSRASVIVLTHADEVSEEARERIVLRLMKKIPREKIFFGCHATKGIFSCGEKRYLSPNEVRAKKFVAFAGIGSFDGFLSSLRQAGVDVAAQLSYPDHYAYAQKDVARARKQALKSGASGIITTRKDWMRLRGLVDENSSDFYLLDIEFRLMGENSEKRFLRSKQRFL